MRAQRLEFALTFSAWVGITALILSVVSGTLRNPELVGGHDWDQMLAHRYLVVKSILEFAQFPFWNPYGCGGHTAWGGVESDVTVVSPWLPAYLLLALPIAVRVELIGTALLSALGTWLLAGRFTRSPAARALACAFFVVNGRWAMQAAVGHTWHLYYAWTPWALFFFDKACLEEQSKRYLPAVAAGAAMALMVYTGGIYALPQTAFISALYALLVAIRRRSVAPLGMLLVTGLTSFGFSALKLLPALDMMRKYPRLVESTEAINLTAFVQAFTAPGQTTHSRPADVPQWGWHEYGIYVGWVPFLGMLAALIFARGRESAIKWCGGLCLLLGFGAFHRYAPWALLHELPIFKSQHVPVRWQYPGTLLLGVALASFIERGLRRAGRRRPMFEVFGLLAVSWVGYDIANNARLPLNGAFYRSIPSVRPRAEFRQFDRVPAELRYRDYDWAPPALPAMMANVGTIECGTFPGFHAYFRAQPGGVVGLGATGEGDPKYRGEAYVVSGQGSATITRFSPNEIVVQLSSARVNDLAILNQNWDAGWSVNGEPALNHRDTLAARVREPNEVLVFRYRPRTLWVACLIFAATVAAVSLGAWKRGTRQRKARQLA